MYLFIIIIIVALLTKHYTSINAIKRGDKDYVIEYLTSQYIRIREHIGFLSESPLITVGTYLFELDGELSSSSGYLSLCVRSQTGVGLEYAKELCLEIIYHDDMYYYQLPYRESFSLSEKRYLLNKVTTILKETCPHDIIDNKSNTVVGLVNIKKQLIKEDHL